MKIAIYPGSFDPITLGHLDIIRRAAACFDRVCVCVSPNAEKRNQMFTPEQKLQLVRTAVAQVADGVFHPLVVEAHPVDQRVVFGQPEQARARIARLRFRGDRSG